MATERELKTNQEQGLFKLERSRLLLESGNLEELRKYLKVSILEAQSGMTAEEIDAVRNRAMQANE